MNSDKSSRKQKDHATREIQKVLQNNSTDYYHYLPKTDIFEGGVVNFRKINSYTSEGFCEVFSDPTARIAMTFLKDIIARFSSFYARQGQPDFDADILFAEIQADKQK